MTPILWKLLCGAIAAGATATGIYAGMKWHEASKSAKEHSSTPRLQAKYLQKLLDDGKIDIENYKKAILDL